MEESILVEAKKTKGNDTGVVRINKSDFDPEIHKLHKETKKEAADAEDEAEADAKNPVDPAAKAKADAKVKADADAKAKAEADAKARGHHR